MISIIGFTVKSVELKSNLEKKTLEFLYQVRITVVKYLPSKNMR